MPKECSEPRDGLRVPELHVGRQAASSPSGKTGLRCCRQGCRSTPVTPSAGKHTRTTMSRRSRRERPPWSTRPLTLTYNSRTGAKLGLGCRRHDCSVSRAEGRLSGNSFRTGRPTAETKGDELGGTCRDRASAADSSEECLGHQTLATYARTSAVTSPPERSTRTRHPAVGNDASLRALQVAPAALFLGVFLLAPLFVFLLYSFWTRRGFEFVADWTTDNYTSTIGDGVLPVSSPKHDRDRPLKPLSSR